MFSRRLAIKTTFRSPSSFTSSFNLQQASLVNKHTIHHPISIYALSRRTMATSSTIHLEAGQQPAFRFKEISAESAEATSKLLQQNHEKFHMFFNSSGFHNHIVHHLLTLLALNATPDQIKTGYNNNTSYQRPPKTVKATIVEDMHDPKKFNSLLGKQESYNAFLAYFQDEISKKGWEDVLQEYVLSGDERADDMLIRLYQGFLHPLIHLGFGIEFQQPAIIAEGLAQAAAHQNWMAPVYIASEKGAKEDPTSGSKTIVQLLEEMRQDEKLSNSPRMSDSNKIRDGIMKRAPEEMIKYASQFFVKEDELEEKTAEMVNAAAYFAAAAQRPPYKVKFDFFYMHAVNSSIFFTTFLSTPSLTTSQKARLLEYKVRTDLALYVSRGCPQLHISEIQNYASKQDSSWEQLFERVVAYEDDGHTSKFIRALANGAKVSEKWEHKEGFLLKGDMWRVVANMVIDSVEGESVEYIRDVGFEDAWKNVPKREGGKL